MSNAKLPAPEDECRNCGHEFKDHHVSQHYCRKWTSVVDWEWDYARLFSPAKPLQVEGPTTTDQKIKAPFTSEQVKRLNAFQKSGLFHPFTCGNPERTDENHPDRGILVATRGGWVCPNCYYTQDWAHAFMVEAGAEATTKPDYLNKTLRECSREELMEALRVTEEKNKAIDAKSRISPEALDVRAGAEATGKSDWDFKQNLAIEVVARFVGNSRGLPIAKREFVNGAMWAKDELLKVLEARLKPGYQNDVFTWAQIQRALDSTPQYKDELSNKKA